MHIAILDVVIRVALVLATAFLFSIVLLSYLRLKNRRMLLVTTGFGIFLAHAVATLPELISDAYALALGENAHLLLHMAALLFILAGILKE